MSAQTVTKPASMEAPTSAPIPATATRARRRELHRSRSVAVSVALAVLILVLALAGTESVLAALGLPALVLAPVDAIALLGAPVGGWSLLAAGVMAILGVIAVVLAVAPGRRARHALDRDRVVVIVDDSVLASAVSRSAASAAGVPQSQVSTTVSRRVGRIVLRPTSGFPIDLDAVRAAAVSITDVLSVGPTMRTDVRLDPQGVITR